MLRMNCRLERSRWRCGRLLEPYSVSEGLESAFHRQSLQHTNCLITD